MTFNDLFPAHYLDGYALVIVPDVPKMQLSKRVCEYLSPAFIAETNAWMLDFFGTTNMLPDGQAIVVNNESLLMNRRTYEDFIRAIRRKNENHNVVRMADYRR